MPRESCRTERMEHGWSIDTGPTALIRGAGDLATGVAMRLARAGYLVVMTETAEPTVVRRKASLADAVYEGRATV